MANNTVATYGEIFKALKACGHNSNRLMIWQALESEGEADNFRKAVESELAESFSDIRNLSERIDLLTEKMKTVKGYRLRELNREFVHYRNLYLQHVRQYSILLEDALLGTTALSPMTDCRSLTLSH